MLLKYIPANVFLGSYEIETSLFFHKKYEGGRQVSKAFGRCAELD